MPAGAASVMRVPATLCSLMPCIVVTVKFFHFVKLSALDHGTQLFKAFRPFYPKTRNIGRRIRRKQCRQTFMPRNPITVCRLNELRIPMNRLSFRSHEHTLRNTFLKR